MKHLPLLMICLSVWACQSSPKRLNTEIELPFYVEETFTPTWVEENTEEYVQIHRIAPFSFLDQNGDTVSERSVKGKIYVANFFFSICPGVCPKMTRNLKLLQKQYGQDDRIMILSHSVMPWVDSVQRLHDYAELNSIRSPQWRLLTGDKTMTYDLARNSYFADEGFGKNVTTEEDFLHTEKLVLIDDQRRIRGVYNGTLPLEVKRMMEDISTLLD
ncbi:hypothetical protein BFP72_18205 [Reichenbachiella sp. 5M10]|uniref:SCO family protein n=1 Tax=Reichenbachiella sp. 5M10 TaxID=1889772 RepID=UPI000C1601E5|nr:SCO family protein [Reichenbachiella sp. 5M10]PIB37202.1 hypothetical protein BFP72_18205 [Reichenbachiella sp. 5M10]